MTKTILFKAKVMRPANGRKVGDWVRGQYFVIDDNKGKPCHQIVQRNGKAWEINPNTLCEFIGKHDCACNPIFDGDILERYFFEDGAGTPYRYTNKDRFVIEWAENGTRWQVKFLDDLPGDYICSTHCIDSATYVVGNIYD